jgi:hypothetical protein
MNACAVRPVDFASFTGAVQHLGMFWALVNLRPRNGAG